jgi:CAAX prenyl protease-like protein
MKFLSRKYTSSPELARIAPFAVFAALTFLQGRFGPLSLYWVYLLKTVIGAWMIWAARPFVEEMRWKLSWEGLAVGVIIFAAWVGLDGLYPRLARAEGGWNPNQQFGAGSAISWFYLCVRIGGSTLVVPPLEEIFYRSLLYRCLVKSDFRTVPLSQFHALSFVITSVVFGLAHPDRWLAGILCGFAYQGLTVKNGRLGDAMTAHAVTNFLLGVWIVWKGAWQFW